MRILPLVLLTGTGATTVLTCAAARAGDAAAVDERDIQAEVRAVYLQAHSPVLDLIVPQSLSGRLYPELSVEFRPFERWAAELAIGVPTDFNLGTGLYHLRLMPITGTVRHEFVLHSAFRPYLGAGIHYTTTSLVANESGLSSYTSLASESTGWVAQAGFDAQLTRSLFLNADVRYLGNLEPQELFHGAPDGNRYVIDPFLISLGIGYRWTSH